jgi:hypothetical protein
MGGMIEDLVAAAKERCARDHYLPLCVKVAKDPESGWREFVIREVLRKRYVEMMERTWAS